MELIELEKAFEVLRERHGLPKFDELNAAFDIGKIERDSGNLLRDVRKLAVEKIAHYLRLMELMLNPSQASPIFLILLKEVTPTDKAMLDSIFTSFIELELASYRLDVQSSDTDEAQFIQRVYRVWNDQRRDVLVLLGILERNWRNAAHQHTKSRDYFS